MADRGPVGRWSGSPRADGFRLHWRRVLGADDLHADRTGERALLVDRRGHAHAVALRPGLEIVHWLIGQRHLYRPGWRFCFWDASRVEFLEFRARVKLRPCIRREERRDLRRGLHRERTDERGLKVGTATDETAMRGFWAHYRSLMETA